MASFLGGSACITRLIWDGNLIVPAGRTITVDEIDETTPSHGVFVDGVATPIANSYILSSAAILVAHDAMASLSAPYDTYTKSKSILLRLSVPSAVLRVSFRFNGGGNATYMGRARIYKNGVAYGIEHFAVAWESYEEDLDFADGDTIELWMFKNGSGGVVYCENFRVLGGESFEVVNNHPVLGSNS